MNSFYKNISNSIKSITNSYNKSSLWCKILIFTILLLLLVILFRGVHGNKEGFEHEDKFLFKTGTNVYDDFYSNVYDYLVYNKLKDDYEVGQIVNKTTPTTQSRIVDIGSGTGHHVAELSKKGFEVLGIDISPSMISKAKENYPNLNFTLGDALNPNLLERDSYTHIMCMYFTIYYIKDKKQFFDNCMKWLMPGGHLFVHLVDRDHFDPILPPGNPLLYVSPQRYAKKRITSTKIKFTDFAYNSNFDLDGDNDTARFTEKFTNDKTGKVRKHEHIMHMPPIASIINIAQSSGFVVEAQIDLMQCQYEYQYLFMFIKPI
jgi:SAM-dependent methyltransferase